MLLADWRNGLFAILLAVGVLLVGYALATRNRMPAAEGPMFREGPDPSPPVQTAVPMDRVHMYGVVGVGEARGGAFAITRMAEKPPRAEAPSNLIITGRYILQPEIFDILADQTRGAGGEIQLTHAMIRLAEKQPFYGLKFQGRSFDCGSKVGFLAANVAYALAREDIAPSFRAELKALLGD
jgi:UTP--glucose-1-phosphate uridylyltransferase